MIATSIALGVVVIIVLVANWKMKRIDKKFEEKVKREYSEWNIPRKGEYVPHVYNPPKDEHGD